MPRADGNNQGPMFRDGQLTGQGSKGPKAALGAEDTYSVAQDGTAQGGAVPHGAGYGTPQGGGMPVMGAVAPRVLSPQKEFVAEAGRAKRAEAFRDFEDGRQRATLLEQYFKIEDVDTVKKEEALFQYTLSCVGSSKDEITVESIGGVAEKDLQGLWNIDQSKKGALLEKVAEATTKLFDISDLEPATLHLSQMAKEGSQREKDFAIKRLGKAASKDFGNDKVRAKMHVIEAVAKAFGVSEVDVFPLISAARETVLNPDEQQAGQDKIANAKIVEVTRQREAQAQEIAGKRAAQAKQDDVIRGREASLKPGANDGRQISGRAAAFAASQGQGRDRAPEPTVKRPEPENIYDSREDMDARANQQAQGTDVDAPPPVFRGAGYDRMKSRDANNAVPPRPEGLKPGTSPSGPSATFEGAAVANVLTQGAASQAQARSARQTSTPEENMDNPAALLAEMESSQPSVGGQQYARTTNEQIGNRSSAVAPTDAPPARSNRSPDQGGQQQGGSTERWQARMAERAKEKAASRDAGRL